MSKKDERYLNITLQNENDDKDNVVISFPTIFKMLKKYLLIWIITAVVTAMLIFSATYVFSSDDNKKLSALVSFTYSGIEKGLDPNGNTFDVNQIKTPAVIEAALTELGEPLSNLENIRQGISISGVIPSDAIDRITAYKSVYENAQSGNLNAAQAMLDVEYYPTQYEVKFNYAASGYDSNKAALVFNTMLDCYRDYFFETYGYNRALGSAVSTLNYNDYDYAEAIDVFSTTLDTLKSYVNNLANDDTTRFRSSITGYTFADLSESIKTISDIDLDVISSYITVNNVTKDKTALIDYYNYRVDSLNRQKTIAAERLASLNTSIETYEKDTVLIFGNGTENTDTNYTLASETYNDLISEKIETQSELSNATQQINFYNKRIEALKGTTTASKAKIEKVEADLKSLNEKINTLIDDINKTANEYYETVSYANAYNILVPATSSSINELKNAIKESEKPFLVVEVLLAAVYIAYAVVLGILDENKKRKAALAVQTETPKDTDDDKETPSEK